jgi:hypothetical protein
LLYFFVLVADRLLCVRQMWMVAQAALSTMDL